MGETIVSYTKLSESAIIPSRAHDTDAGYDLYSTQDYCLLPGIQQCIPTDIAIALPPGYFGQIAPKSGLALKYALHVLGGIVDQGYSGNISVIMINLAQEAYQVHRGDKIAQYIILPYLSYILETTDIIPESTRGVQGFGSSGR